MSFREAPRLLHALDGGSEKDFVSSALHYKKKPSAPSRFHDKPNDNSL